MLLLFSSFDFSVSLFVVFFALLLNANVFVSRLVELSITLKVRGVKKVGGCNGRDLKER